MDKAKRKWGVFSKVRFGRRLARERAESWIGRVGRKAHTLVHEMGPRQVAAVPVAPTLTPAHQGEPPSRWFSKLQAAFTRRPAQG